VPVIGIPCRRFDFDQTSECADFLPSQPVHGVLTSYIEALNRCAASIVLLPVQRRDLALTAFEQCDGLLLAGGEDVTASLAELSIAVRNEKVTRDTIEFELLSSAITLHRPVLGICRGMQLINLFHGGSVRPLVEILESPLRHVTRWREDEKYVHTVTIAPNCLLNNILASPECVPVNCNHSSTIDVLGKGLIATAFSDDGATEALETIGGSFCIAVQWHPESPALGNDPYANAILRSFVSACEAMRPQEVTYTE